MRIGDMDSHCGDCDLIDWCGDPFEDPYLCTDSRFEGMDTEEYIKLAESSKATAEITEGGDDPIKEAIADDVYRRAKGKSSCLK